MESVLGRVIGGRYQIAEDDALIGEGGMGKVFRGIDRDTGKSVAIKLLDPQIVASNPDVVKRFTREADALRRVNHPNIVRVHTTIDDGDMHYIVMDYVEGGTLLDLLGRSNVLPMKRILKIASGVADALAAAHNKGIIHRDIKPGNVLLSKDGRALLSDFGVAFINDNTRMTQSGIVVGTISYLSPEALNGDPLDARADIWAFGVMLFEMVCGQHPFDDTNMTTLVTSIVTQPVPDIAAMRPVTPPELIALIYKMLQKNRNQRIESAGKVSAEIEKILLVAENKQVDNDLMSQISEDGNLEPIQNLIKAGNKSQARILLRPVLKANPTAEAWYLAAQVVDNDEQAIKYLKKALEVDPWHSPSNRMLHKLEGVKPLFGGDSKIIAKEEIQPLEPLKRNPKAAPYERQRKNSVSTIWRRIGCLSAIVLSMTCSLFTMGMVGVIPGVINGFNAILGGKPPVVEINGVPIEQIPEAPVIMEPSQIKAAPSQGMDVMDHGLMTEYRFDARAGEVYYIWVQFLSVSANRVSRNVALIDPFGQEMSSICVSKSNLIQGDNGVAMEECAINTTGTWKVRVLGRQGESVGAYFVGVQKLNY